jgi:hypothetical protein
VPIFCATPFVAAQRLQNSGGWHSFLRGQRGASDPMEERILTEEEVATVFFRKSAQKLQLE